MKEYTIPKHITIAGIKIKIEYVDDCEDFDFVGLYDPVEQKITLVKVKEKTFLYSTYIHEVIEAINWIYDMNLKHHQICLLQSALAAMNIDFREVTK